jgi:tetratricopeptide (TPR) repeat protein
VDLLMSAPRLRGPAVLVALALAGASLVVYSVSLGSGSAAPPLPLSPENPHAAAGVVASNGPEVTAAFEQRVAALETRLRDSPDDLAALLELARLLHDGHRVQKAVALYRRAIELEPTAGQPYYDLASAHADLGDWAAARTILQERLTGSPGDAVAMYDLGAVEANAGDPDSAILWWQRSRETTTDTDLKTRADAAISQLRASPEPPRPK